MFNITALFTLCFVPDRFYTPVSSWHYCLRFFYTCTGHFWHMDFLDRPLFILNRPFFILVRPHFSPGKHEDLFFLFFWSSLFFGGFLLFSLENGMLFVKMWLKFRRRIYFYSSVALFFVCGGHFYLWQATFIHAWPMCQHAQRQHV